MEQRFLRHINKFYFAILIVQLWGIVLLTLGFVGYSSKLISLFGYFIYFFAAIYFIQALFKNRYKPSFIQLLFVLWVGWIILSAIPVLFDSDRNYIRFKQFISGAFFLYLFNFIMIARLDIDFYKKLYRLSYKLVLLYLIVNIFLFFYFIDDIENGAESLTFLMGGVAPLLMTMSYHSRLKRTLILISVFVVIIGMMILARRNAVVYYGSVLMMAFSIGFITKQTLKKNVKLQYFRMGLMLIFLTAMVIFLFSDSFSFFWERVGTGMESREGIIENFVQDFNRSPNDWITGRGLFGEFEGGILATNKDTGMRDLIENGYLMLILKGGWIYLGLLIALSLQAMYKGFFKSKNLLVKGFAAIILIYYIDMIGYGIPMLNLKYFMVFIGIATCNNKWLREQTDEYLSNQIGLK
jgi:hypothetical protein